MDRGVLLILMIGVIALHIIWILLILGGLVGALTGWLFRHPRFQFGLNLLLVGSIGSWLIFGACLFTVWEKALRAQLGWPVYAPGFLIFWFDRLGLPISSFGVTITVVTVIALLLFLQIWPIVHLPDRPRLREVSS